jgi:hypothetical protein
MYIYKNNERHGAVMGEVNLSTEVVSYFYTYIIYTCMYKYTKPGMLRGGKEKGEEREGQHIAAALVRIQSLGAEVNERHDGRGRGEFLRPQKL